MLEAAPPPASATPPASAQPPAADAPADAPAPAPAAAAPPAAAPPPAFDVGSMPHIAIVVPTQHNTHDCGCFLLVFVQHFCGALRERGYLLPDALTPQLLVRARAAREKGLPSSRDECSWAPEHGAFFGARWFHRLRGIALRLQIKNLVLQAVVEQEGGRAGQNDPGLLALAAAELAAGREAAAAEDERLSGKEERRRQRVQGLRFDLSTDDEAAVKRAKATARRAAAEARGESPADVVVIASAPEAGEAEAGEAEAEAGARPPRRSGRSRAAAALQDSPYRTDDPDFLDKLRVTAEAPAARARRAASRPAGRAAVLNTSDSDEVEAKPPPRKSARRAPPPAAPLPPPAAARVEHCSVAVSEEDTRPMDAAADGAGGGGEAQSLEAEAHDVRPGSPRADESEEERRRQEEEAEARARPPPEEAPPRGVAPRKRAGAAAASPPPNMAVSTYFGLGGAGVAPAAAAAPQRGGASAPIELEASDDGEKPPRGKKRRGG